MVHLCKEPNAIVIKKFCLIILGNFLFKICTKILVDQLVGVVGRIVYGNQFVFF